MRALLLLATAALLSPAAASAQQSSDAKWNAWLGCWELVVENARDTAAMTAPPARREFNPQRDGIRPQVCVEPAPGGARFTTRVGTQTPIEQTVIADGTDRPFTDNDCAGTQRAEWSQDGRRLFARADLSCANDKGNRRVSGYSILGLNGTWTDIQAVDISGQQTVRVRRYRRVAQAAPVRRSDERTPLTIDDIKEAATKVSAPALEAAIVETGSIFDLAGKDLIALQGANVPASVTDLMVAVSYPSKFVVERRARADVPPPLLMDDPFMLGWAFGYPMWSDLYGIYSPLYGPYSSFYYSPFAYSYLRYYDPRFFWGGIPVIVEPGGGGSTPSPTGNGRVVDGLGYTRVRAREAETTTSRPPGIVTGGGGGGSTGGAAASSGGGGGGVSSQGFSSGGGSDTGRTAQPR